MDWTAVQSQHTKEENYLSFHFLTSMLCHLNNTGSASGTWMCRMARPITAPFEELKVRCSSQCSKLARGLHCSAYSKMLSYWVSCVLLSLLKLDRASPFESGCSLFKPPLQISQPQRQMEASTTLCMHLSSHKSHLNPAWYSHRWLCTSCSNFC